MNSILTCEKRGLSLVVSVGLLAVFAAMMPILAHAAVPTATTNAATSVAGTTATVNGTVNPNNRNTTVTFQYGLTAAYGTTVNATPNTLASGTGSAAVSAALTGLACSTTYHFQVVGVNSSGTTYGGDLTFATTACAPTATTGAATSLTATGATLNGAVSSNGASTAVTFDYGLTATYGSTITATTSPLAANATNSAVSAAATGLTCNTTYHFRVNGVNGAGTTHGGDLTFTTTACVPTVTTNAASALTVSGATLNGTVSSNGASTTVTFDYGLTNSYGSTATATASPLIGTATNAAVSATVTGLVCNTTYHFRVKGVNSAGTTNGNDVTFSTSACPTAVTLAKTAGTAAAAVGSYVTYTLTATNSTAAALNTVVLTDAIPASMTYITSAPTLGTVSLAGQLLTWTIPYLPSGGSAQLTLVVQPTVKGTYTNTVQSTGAVDASADILILPSAITRYSMDETAGSWTGATGEVIDSGGNGLNGHRRTTTTPTTTNAVAPSPTIASQHPSVVGGYCNAGNFDGNAVVESASSTYFQFTNKLSASAWIYPTAYPTSDLYSILSNDVNYEFHLDTGGHLYWWWNSSNLASAAVIPLNTWTHIAITMDSSLGTSSRERIYINGVADANTNNWSGTLANNTCPFYIGGDISTNSGCTLMPGRNFHGMIDEAKIYNYELSAAEVNADMNLGRLCGTSSFDHIQIEHDGTASTCASKTVTVKACMNAACTSLYPGTVTVHLSPTGWTPSDVLTINGGVATATLGNTSIVAPSITLGTTSVSPTPANNTRCFNGATETCTLSVATTACTFDAVEVGANPQTHLFTKLAGTAFNVDVLALSNATTVNSNYTGAVTVDLVDTSTVACPNGAPLNTAQTYTFVTADHGRKTFAMNCANAAPNVQVRIKVGSTTTYACSTDKLAVRPSAATLTSANALVTPVLSPTTTTVDPGNGNIIQAGTPFNIAATTSPTAGYTGVLLLSSGMLSAQLPTDMSHQSLPPSPGGSLGTLTLNPAVQANNTVQGNNATYDEVGYFYVNAGAFRDTGFTSVDQLAQPNGCATTDTCDCLLSTNATNGSVPDNLSDVLINGRYGCYVGNKTPYSFGRFVPDHFETAIIAVGSVPMSCPAAAGLACPVSYNGFVYSGQAFTTQVTAKNAICPLGVCGTTQNYYSNFAKAVTLTAWDSIGGATNQNPGPGVLSIPTALVASDFLKGVGVEKDALANPVPYATYTFNTTPTVPTKIYLRAVDADNVSSRIMASPGTSIEGGVMVVSGRMKISDAYGSELLPLPVNATVQYYNTAGSWLTSTTDSVTSFNPAVNLVPSIVKGPLAVGNISVTNVGMVTVAGGVRSFKLNRPGVSGSADLNLNVPSYLLAGGNVAAVNPSVAGRVTFGVYKAPIIYMRETY